MTDILRGIQDLLANPNPKSPANNEAFELWRRSPARYEQRIQQQVQALIAARAQ